MNPNINGMLQQLMQNPAQMLSKNGFKVTGEMTNPLNIIQQLLNSGQISQQQLNQAQAMAANFQRMIR